MSNIRKIINKLWYSHMENDTTIKIIFKELIIAWENIFGWLNKNMVCEILCKEWS